MPERLAATPLEDRTAPAAVGGLDLTFGDDGTVMPNAALDLPDTTVPVAIGRQSDGRLVVGTTAFFATGGSDFAVFRLQADGSVDTTFGDGGIATIPFDLGGTKADTLAALVVLPDDRIVLAGTAVVAGADTDFAVARLTADGDLDDTFNGTGTQTAAFDQGGSNADAAAAVAVDSLGRVVVAGAAARATAGDFDFAVVRLTAAGAADKTFSTDGFDTVAFDLAGGTFEDKAAGVAIGPGDAVVLVGTVNAGGVNVDAGVARLTEAGDPDDTFDGDGSRVYGLDVAGTMKADTAVGVAVLPDGRIVFAGTVAVTGAGDTDFYAARLLDTGEPDPDFGGFGFISAGFNLGGSERDAATAVAVDFLGRVVVAGSVEVSGTDFDFGVCRFRADGTLDPSFDADGCQRVAFDEGGTLADLATAVAVQPDGRVVLAGPVALGSGAAVGVARLHGSLGLAATLSAGGPIAGQAATFLLDSDNLYTAGDVYAPFPGYLGPVRPAVADFNGDGVDDVAVGIGPEGGSLVRIIDGVTGTDLVPLTVTYEDAFTGGLFLAAADFDGDGRAELVTAPDTGGSGRVQIFSVSGIDLVQRDNFFGIDDPDFRGGARVAAGDLDGNSRPELIVAAGFGGGPRVAVFDGRSLLFNLTLPEKLVGDFFAFPGPDAVTLRNGVFVAAGDFDADGAVDLAFGGGPGGGPRVYILAGARVAADDVAGAQAAPLANFFVAGDADSRGGVRLAAKDVDDDDRAELVAASGDGAPSVITVYLGNALPAPDGTEPAFWQEFDPFGNLLEFGVFVG